MVLRMEWTVPYHIYYFPSVWRNDVVLERWASKKKFIFQGKRTDGGTRCANRMIRGARNIVGWAVPAIAMYYLYWVDRPWDATRIW